jgi:hypothetical protein
MYKVDWTLKSTLVVIAMFLGMIALRPYFDTNAKVFADSAKFDHVYIAAPGYLYKGEQGLLVMDKRNGNVWFIPKGGDIFKDPVFVIRVPFEKLDPAPR